MMSSETTSSLDARDRLTEVLRLDLVGPTPGHALAEECIEAWHRPSNWYLTGFLIPSDAPEEDAGDDESEDDFEDVPADVGLAEENTEDRKAAKKAFFPSSMGLSFLVASSAKAIRVRVTWGDYKTAVLPAEGDKKELPIWGRQPREAEVDVGLVKARNEPLEVSVPDSDGLQLTILVREIDHARANGALPKGARSVSVFLVNHRVPDESKPDQAFIFQPELVIGSDQPFLPRPDLRGLNSEDWDEQVADLHYADTPEYATGHGIAADWSILDGACREVRTAWIPSALVEKTETAKIVGVDLEMEKLGALKDGAAAEATLRPLVQGYRSWIAVQRGAAEHLSGSRREVAELLLDQAEFAAKRIEAGIATLVEDEQALDAFRMANRAVACALKKRLRDILNGAEPSWRAFQLAFILLNLRGMAKPEDENRETVDLLFFPTGGGKTEAYLGLAAFAMVLRRLHHPGLLGAGVSVMMRYTLRLLTLDQLGRAAGLICALELERKKDESRYGSWPFEIGLWVGKAATPNVMGKKGDHKPDTARAKTIAYKNNPKGKPSPIPLENCPWCGTRFTEDSFTLLPNDDAPTDLRVCCADWECEFSGDNPLPILSVDEPIYRRLPAFLVATVDKFASLPFVGQSGLLLGGATHQDGEGFYGAATSGRGKRLPMPLSPIDLVIQDELHLIAGPLGTMAGLYETAIEALATSTVAGKPMRPKIVASTATVRRAPGQIQALFGRSQTLIFPPPGPDRRDSFFAQTKSSDEVAARRYISVAAQGRNPKVVFRRTVTSLMSAAQNLFIEAGGYIENNPADPYMTVLGYFNSLRELGGSRRILEEEVQNTIKAYGSHRRLNEEGRMFRDRRSFNEVVELTSRVSTDQVAAAKQRLETDFRDVPKGYKGPRRVDCALATNMISVGLDITRLGLMIVNGQPKTHSEYIQASSRVGRDDKRPGLVVTLLNIHKPRDRSHYERFRHYHETFYRAVEVSSVTPFSPRALDRGFAGAMVALARHSLPALTAPLGAQEIAANRAAVERRLIEVFEVRVRSQSFASTAELEERLNSVRSRIKDLLDSWIHVVKNYQDDECRVQYQPYESRTSNAPKALLRDMLEDLRDDPHAEKFKANRSLRDVEPEVNLYLRDLSGRWETKK